MFDFEVSARDTGSKQATTKPIDVINILSWVVEVMKPLRTEEDGIVSVRDCKVVETDLPIYR